MGAKLNLQGKFSIFYFYQFSGELEIFCLNNLWLIKSKLPQIIFLGVEIFFSEQAIFLAHGGHNAISSLLCKGLVKAKIDNISMSDNFFFNKRATEYLHKGL